MKPVKTGIIILAAGSSSRLGQPKQLLKYQGKTLIRRAIDTALECKSDASVLVIGANFELIKKEVQDTNVDIVINHVWETGMASGMQMGLNFLDNKIAPDQVILMLCDQPFVDSELLNNMIGKQTVTSKGIIACHYNGTFGVPALFTSKYFPELIELRGSEGAKKVIYAHLDDMEKMDFPNAAIDIDTPEDYLRLTRGD
ncbi:molybdenum cofactor cytidylyltransferase [Aquiflexum balticum DSM 16537]|uniref:Molybdenum cofactor cytidylyltransferase n=1 Tax=Aquiflexum balticum DSM 16537 TaxID=758820 RepID=A0A1W2H8X7_9BACT|nr:nucleotidyltransferase family protein [Aquiflexum balticum]SMD45056.1 molybdenum cofactor cytidylyltransferase [Aquiflexum balticum DSM 16537]